MGEEVWSKNQMDEERKWRKKFEKKSNGGREEMEEQVWAKNQMGEEKKKKLQKIINKSIINK